MEKRQPHFAVSEILPELQSLEDSVGVFIEQAGGGEAIFRDALSLLREASTAPNIPVALVKEVVKLLAQGMQQNSQG